MQARACCVMCSALVITPNNVMYAAVQGDVGGVAPRIHYIAPVMNSHHCVLCDCLSILSVVLVSTLVDYF